MRKLSSILAFVAACGGGSIEFADKGVKKVDVNRRFVPGDGQVIELRDDRPIERIMIFMDPDSNGTFEIFGA